MEDSSDHVIVLGPRWAALSRLGRRFLRGIPRFLFLWTLFFLFCALLNLLYRGMGWYDLDRESSSFEMVWIGLAQALFFIPGLLAYMLLMPRLGSTWSPVRRRLLATVAAPVLIWLAPTVGSLGFLLWVGTTPLPASVAVGLVGPIPKRRPSASSVRPSV